MVPQKNPRKTKLTLAIVGLALLLAPAATAQSSLGSEVNADAYASADASANADAAYSASADVAADAYALVEALEARAEGHIASDAELEAHLDQELGAHAYVSATGDLMIASEVVATACEQTGIMPDATARLAGSVDAVVGSAIASANAAAGATTSVELDSAIEGLCANLEQSLGDVSAKGEAAAEAEVGEQGIFAQIKATVSAFFSGLF